MKPRQKRLALIGGGLAAILVSLENLMTYPWIAERVVAGALHLHGWYFDMTEASLLCYNPARNAFEPIEADAADPSGSQQ
ncbi:MAG: carbonic anhydrase [Rhodocyclaceae bacterium]|nr:carbonic anhydrase [Rhodocyclaceae bacterium]